MGYSGPKPKEDRSQIRHRNPVHEFREIPDVPHDGPKLPKRLVFVEGKEWSSKWPSATLAWWETIRQMPHAKDWVATDWQHAFATAEVHARLHETGRGAWVELARREKVMGTTLSARNDMRIRYVAPSVATAREEAGEVEPVTPVARLDDYREMYS